MQPDDSLHCQPQFEGWRIPVDALRVDSSTVPGATDIISAADDHLAVRGGNNFYAAGTCLLLNVQLARCRRALASAPRDIISLMPASVWLFDNYHLLYHQLKEIRPTIVSRAASKLPTIRITGVRVRLPRIAALADIITSSCDGGIDEDLICRQLELYQSKCILTSAEIWMLHPWLKLAILRKLATKSGVLIKWLDIKCQADRLADDLDQIEAVEAPDLISRLSTRKIYQDNKDETVWKAHMIYRLRRRSYLDENIGEFVNAGTTQAPGGSGYEAAGEIISREEQAESQLERDVSQLIISLRFLSTLDWSNIFEKSSCLEQKLIQDPSSIYEKMDSDSRDHYRKSVARLAKSLKCTECQLAYRLQEFCENYRLGGSEAKEGEGVSPHNGVALLGYLRTEFLKTIGHEVHDRSKRTLLAIIYFTSVSLLAVTMTALFTILIAPVYKSLAALAATAAAAVIPLIGCAAGSINAAFLRLVHPRPIMSMDYTDGLPDHARTFVVMPVIFKNEQQVRDAVIRLEQHYLANPQSNFCFGILGDLHDSQFQISPEDELIINRLDQDIETLNRRYPTEPKRFYGFMRRRVWNSAEHCWMGWERKRGKLEEFNRILRKQVITTWGNQMPDADFLESFQYVITLDADSELVKDSAAHLVGIISHPLNRPELDIGRRRLKRGYAILQSSMKIRLAGGTDSPFRRLFSNPTGIDPYSSVSSDIYQDTFHEGTYVGKGIYSIDAMQLLLTGKLPENHILSHDLLESCYARCAFVSNVQLMDCCPAGFLSFMRREHRWIRGDWQLLPWLFKRGRLSRLSKWKIFDNIRRSLTAPACLLLVLTTALFASEYIWIAVLPAIYLPALRLLQYMGGNLLRKLLHPFAHLAWRYFLTEAIHMLAQELFCLLILPYRAWNACDAVFRALYRMIISHRRLLEWQTASSADRSDEIRPLRYFLIMWSAPASGLYLIISALPSYLPAQIYSSTIWTIVLGAAWLISPYVAWIISRSRSNRMISSKLDDSDIRILNNISLDTWHYFAEQADESTGWLVPDNWQEQPGPRRSDKTSPTNIGMQLLCTLAARDLGYAGLVSTIETCERILDTLIVLPRYRGHFYNWYSIGTGEVLMPDYISTVDSGNLLASLITLRQGLNDLKKQCALSKNNQEAIKMLCQRCEMTEQAARIPVTKPDEWSRQLCSLLKDLSDTSEFGDQGLRTEQGWLSYHTKDMLSDHSNDLVSVSSFDKPIIELARSGHKQALNIITRIDRMIIELDGLISDMDFSWLYDRSRNLFRIGYRVSAAELDSGCYDLLASEARLASYLAVAAGQVPAEHWKKLGRPMTLVDGNPALVSWSGSLFEYLLPDLLLNSYSGSLLGQSSMAAVRQQLKHGRREKIPWGISESQYYRFDQDGNYQYRAFGVNRLRLQPSRYPARVVAPYATQLAAMVEPVQAMINLRHLIRLGCYGRYGLYEAIDYTDVPRGSNYDTDIGLGRYDRYQSSTGRIIRSHMAHHLGMGLLAADNLLQDNVMKERFHTAPVAASAESLLEETVSGPLITSGGRHFTLSSLEQETGDEPISLRKELPDKPCRSYHVLAGSCYKVVIDSGGEGFSQHENIRLNRWQTVRIRSPQGQFIFLRDIADGHAWSASAEPIRAEKNTESKVLFGIDKAEFIRTEHDIMTNLEIAVSPQEPYELRRLFISNQGKHDRSIEITSYLEPVLTYSQADRAHPAFNRLFIETEFLSDRNLLISHRRTSGTEVDHYLGHQLILPSGNASVEYEIDRLGFIGRDNTLSRPDSLYTGRVHSCRQGFCPEPILSLRTNVRLAAGASTVVIFMTAYGHNRTEIMKLSHEARQPAFAAGVFTRALVHARLKLKYLGMSSKDYNQLIELVSSVYDPAQALRCQSLLLNELASGQQALWRFGISGDVPLVLLEICSSLDMILLDQFLQLFEVFMQNQVEADFVIICDQPAGYRKELYYQILAKTDHLKLALQPKNHHSPFVIQLSDISRQEYVLLICSACLYTGSTKGTKSTDSDQEVLPFMSMTTAVSEKNISDSYISKPLTDNIPLLPEQEQHFDSEVLMAGEKIQLRSDKYGEKNFWNGIGYFDEKNNSYEIRLESGVHTPAPWSNVIANESFGVLVTDKGSGFTWSENSQSGKLTPWSNDPVIDPPGDMLLTRDDESNKITSACRYHGKSQGRYYISHRFGSSVFEHRELDLDQCMTVTVDENQQLCFWHLKVHNLSHHRRKLTVMLYIDLVLGPHEELTHRFLQVSYDKNRELLTAVNRYQELDRQRTAVVFCSDHISGWTTDSRAFQGTGSDFTRLYEFAEKTAFNSRDDSGRSPCAAISVNLQLHDNESREIVFGLGSAQDIDSAYSLAERCRSNRYFHHNLAKVTEAWQHRLGLIRIESPDIALDTMFNGWLLYQVISCRLRARAAFYQCGGAYGFRDQLQDSLALLPHDNPYVRQHLLRCAARQFKEGDVQHWWHEDINIGVRTRISDDLLWLPYVLCRYVESSGDLTILEEQLPWLIGDKLRPDEHDRAFAAERSEETSSLFEHALAAIRYAATFGSHRLPLFGGGDWNDGIDLAGAGGRGESVWLGWFIVTVLDMFISLCARLGHDQVVDELQALSSAYTEALEKSAWDGKWFLRGWFDNGQPMGSRKNLECRIDGISQSWAVLSGKASEERVSQALESADHYLVKDAEKTILLLSPPFDGLGPEPGYIRRYYTGIRENGGHYTHAAVWLAMACLRAGRNSQGAHMISMINPINHALQLADVNRFMTEPYVLPADIYDGDPYTGRGGWSWYTGSASWYYQAILHELIGIREESGELVIEPHLPDSLLPMNVNYKYGESLYVINYRRSSGQHHMAHGIWMDQIKLDDNRIKLEQKPTRHNLLVYIE